jgi:predicted ATP-grasp superfamily ATP-dependent carboligase
MSRANRCVEAAMVDDQKYPGVLLLGGVQSALSPARSFGRKGIPVVLLTDDHQLPGLSRYVSCFDWPGAQTPDAVEWLVNFATEHGLQDWLLIPCSDPDVRFISENLDRFASIFKLMCPDWTVLQKVCDKQLLARTAANAGVAAPKSYRIRSDSDAARVEVAFPVVLKPASRLERNAFTSAKAWQADSREELGRLYRKAAVLVGDDNVVVQELIPGGGATQFSYVALWKDNAPAVEITARRTRQYPIKFSSTSTFVEVVTNDEVAAAGKKLLSSIGFEGLVEAEFKFDARDNTYKILDVNPRPWTWIGLCEAAGVDIPLLMRDLALGKAINPGPVNSDYAWIHVVKDLVVGFQLICGGQITASDYLATLRRKLVFATFASDDPLPGVLELPLTIYRVLDRAIAAVITGCARARAALWLPKRPLRSRTENR